MNSRRQRGNVLFFILIAVALFAALSYAITKSGRSSGDVSSEKIALEISRLENFAVQIKTALLRMRTLENIQEWEVSYDDIYSTSVANGFCVTSKCKLFDPSGGGVPKGIALSNAYQGQIGAHGGKFWFRNVSVKGVGDDNTRDLFILFPNASLSLCLYFNTHVGVDNPSSAPPVDTHQGRALDYSGNIDAQVTIVDTPVYGEETGNPIAGHSSFCVDDGGAYHLYISLIIR